MKKKTHLNEVKQFQKIAGILKENLGDQPDLSAQTFIEAGIDLDKPAYYIQGWGRGSDIYKVKAAKSIISKIKAVAGEDCQLEINPIDDPEATVGSEDEAFQKVIDREHLVPKLSIDCFDVETAWEIWQ